MPRWVLLFAARKPEAPEAYPQRGMPKVESFSGQKRGTSVIASYGEYSPCSSPSAWGSGQITVLRFETSPRHANRLRECAPWYRNQTAETKKDGGRWGEGPWILPGPTIRR